MRNIYHGLVKHTNYLLLNPVRHEYYNLALNNACRKVIERSLCASKLNISASKSLSIASYKFSNASDHRHRRCNYPDPEDSFLIPGGQTSRILKRVLSLAGLHELCFIADLQVLCDNSRRYQFP